MRTLKFIIDKQIIKRDPNCDFDGLVAGTEGYLQAEFSFSSDWDNCTKVAAFYSRGKECPPQVLEDGRTCMIPSEALKGRAFGVRVFGKNGRLKLVTSKEIVCQKGSAK